MKNIFLLVWMLGTFSLSAQDLLTRFERSKGTETVTYQEGIAYWKKLDARFPQIKVLEMGPTDAGYPLHLVLYSTDRDFHFESLHKKHKCIILINNAIHPGEPDGVDASMLLLRDLALGRQKMPDNVVLAVIPFYNIGGVLNRNHFTRANQNGPKEYGFRGNAENLDLNRDFIKTDSKNSRSFQQLFHLADPDIFIDNHVSDGADYQPVMTLLTTQHDKLGGPMGEYLHKDFEPAIYALMKQKGYDMIPYVNHEGALPEKGWKGFHDSPRYSSGYTTLFHTFGFVPETHMLKPYDQRVKSAYALMLSFIEFAGRNSKTIHALRQQQKNNVKTQTDFPLAWHTDTSRYSLISFKGFAAGYKTSQVSGLPRLYYDRHRPFTQKVKFYDFLQPTHLVKKPGAYILSQGWWQVIELLRLNKVKMKRFPKDTTLEVEVYHIEHYQSLPRAYEKHHLNSDVKLSVSRQKIRFLKGDYFIPMNQVANRYLAETLEPTAEDSFFAWNFFDAILQQKEGYSDYVFEDIAAAVLKNDPDLQKKLAAQKAMDTAFAHSARAQLDFVYKHSPWYEPAHLRYPVYRWIQ